MITAQLQTSRIRSFSWAWQSTPLDRHNRFGINAEFPLRGRLTVSLIGRDHICCCTPRWIRHYTLYASALLTSTSAIRCWLFWAVEKGVRPTNRGANAFAHHTHQQAGISEIAVLYVLALFLLDPLEFSGVCVSVASPWARLPQE